MAPDVADEPPGAAPPAMTRELGLKVVEALLFVAEEPLGAPTVQAHLPGHLDALDLLQELQRHYAGRGIRLERHGDRFAFRTAAEVAPHLAREQVRSRRLSKAALETLAIIAYHQPVTRAEIEDMRGVALSKSTLDLLLETEWVAPKGRREAPGRPVTWVTTKAFLDHFGLAALDDLPQIEELSGGGLLALATPVDGHADTGGPEAEAAGDVDEDDAGPEDAAGRPA